MSSSKSYSLQFNAREMQGISESTMENSFGITYWHLSTFLLSILRPVFWHTIWWSFFALEKRSFSEEANWGPGDTLPSAMVIQSSWLMLGITAVDSYLKHYVLTCVSIWSILAAILKNTRLLGSIYTRQRWGSRVVTSCTLSPLSLHSIHGKPWVFRSNHPVPKWHRANVLQLVLFHCDYLWYIG